MMPKMKLQYSTCTYLAIEAIIAHVCSAALSVFPLGVLK